MAALAGQVDCAVFSYALVYAVMVFAGGMMGFIKAKSKASLIASTCVCIVVVGADVMMLYVDPLFSLCTLSVLGLGLTSMFNGKWKKTATAGGLSEPLEGAAGKKKFMPFGLLTIMSVILTVLGIAAAVVRSWLTPPRGA
mmetsp:Transcript_90059/g.209524  ORF Transcript_90059/g.209524 Transcript_90059/m.209524 type:complete len:140 (+) Transcript_90059:63-482(+)